MAPAELIPLFWSLMGFVAFVRSLLPNEVLQAINAFQSRLLSRWTTTLALQHQVTVNEFTNGGATNDLFYSVHRYLGTVAADTADSLSADCPRTGGAGIVLSLAPDQALTDRFRGRPVFWRHCSHSGTKNHISSSAYVLTVNKSDKTLAAEYLAFILAKGRELAYADQQKQFYTNSPDYWSPIPFKPPSTFDTVAMEPDAKAKLIDDIKAFMSGGEYYASIGRPWKRGYLLYGPPGTGKSSLIGAMANLTGYNVYDLELTKVSSNLELRQLLLTVSDRAIVVIEDIDCSIYITNRQGGESSAAAAAAEGTEAEAGAVAAEAEQGDDGVTLSGLLNFTDGILSASGRERIFVFTTNYVERLDPALVRSGRMDMHICMSYCSFAMFKTLVSIYLKINDDDAETLEFTDRYYSQVETLLEEVEVSPADVVEMLLRYRSDTKLALEGLVEELTRRKDEALAAPDDAGAEAEIRQHTVAATSRKRLMPRAPKRRTQRQPRRGRGGYGAYRGGYGGGYASDGYTDY